MTGCKPSNPKDREGVKKVPFSVLPVPVLAEAATALYEGSRKYGRHNYREIGVRGSVYYDAAIRHLTAWWEGEDIDPDSGLSHITKAIAGLMVLRDCMMTGLWNDDRPPVRHIGWYDGLNKKTEELNDKYPEPPNPYTEEARKQDLLNRLAQEPRDSKDRKRYTRLGLRGL